MLAHAAVAGFILRVLFPRCGFARRRALIGWWSRKLLRIVGVATRVSGPPPGEREIGAMVAANHVSWLDIFVISGVRPTRFIAKSEIRDWPIAGWIAERGGTIYIRRDRRRDTARINDLVHAALQQGDCVGLFPEGATTAGDTLLEFHSSLFEPAVANRAHVHPCAIRYEHADGSICRQMSFAGEISFMQSLGLAMRQRGVIAHVAFAPPVETEGAGRREVARAAQDRVASLLGLASPGTAPKTTPDPPAAPR